MGGGSPITISGINMATMPEMNEIIISPTFVSAGELFGPPLSASDEFNSNMYAGKLGYTVPTPMTVMNVPYDSFDGSYLPNGLGAGIKFQIVVQNFDSNMQLFCLSNSMCSVSFRRDYTPYLLDTIPSNVYKGQQISFQMNVKNAHNPEATPVNKMAFRDVRIDNDCVDYHSFIDETSPESFRLPGWTVTQFQAYVGSQTPNFHSEPNILFYGGYQINMRSSQHCNFAGDDCWTIRTHPMIENLSLGSGYTTGGQLLTIQGFGLNGTNVQVTIDGQPCNVQQSQSQQITCITSASQSQSKLGYQPGQTGLTRIKKFINDGLNYQKLSNLNYPVAEFNLSTSFEEKNVNLYTNDMRQLSGWFTAPATGNYRFYISCDDICQLLLDAVNPFVPGSPSSTPPTPTVIASRKSWTSWRNYFYPNSGSDQHMSDWISLQEGQSYYILGQTGNYQGGEHFTVSVEVQKSQSNSSSTTANSSSNTSSSFVHPKASKTVQQLAMDTQNTQEQWSITIQNPDSGSFQINLVVPKTTPPTSWQSAAIPNQASAIQMQNVLQPYYTKNFNALISVTLTMYDSTSAVTTDPTVAKTYSYTITLLRQIIGFSSTAATISSVGKTNSTFSVVPPNKGIQSSPPVNGTYVIKCTDTNGNQWSSTDIQYNTSPMWIEYTITSSIAFLVDKVRVISDNRYLYPENGLSFMLKFEGLDYDVPQCTLDYGTGKYPLTGSTLTPNCTTLSHYGSSLIFEPVPIEFLTSDAKSPQVIVTVDGLPALCANLNCDFVYQTPTSSIDSQSLSSQGVLQLSGVNLPSLDQSQINLGPARCTLVSQSATSVSCSLTDSAVTGSWIAQIISQYGIIPTTISQPIEIPAVISSIAPNTGINSLGGDILVISGDHFGYDPSVVKVSFTDGTTCSVLAVNMVSISCKVNRFTTTITSPVQVTVSINNVTDSSKTIALNPSVSSAVTLVPNSVSPVLKSDLTIYLGSDYAYPLQTSDFTVTLLNPLNASYSKNLFVMSVNQTANSVQFKFPGAHSGNYTIQISSTKCGRLLSDGLDLKVHGTVTNVSPNSGSIYGGALITITGENFSNDPQDNPVQIGSDYCYVITTNATQITCRTDLLISQTAQTELFLVFLKTSEEAEFKDMSQQQFQYVIPNAAITAATVIFNQTTLTSQVVLTGTGFDSSIQLVLDGFVQQLDQQNDTTAVFDVTNVLDISTMDIQVFTSQGYPAGMENIAQLSFSQSLQSISPATGSSGGTWITVQGSGFGINTIGLNIQDLTKKSNMCSQVVIQSYGSLLCLTLPYSIAANTMFSITVNNTVQPGQYVSSSVSYSQSAIISVTSISLNQNAITFTGSGFSLVDTTAQASFAGVNATSVTVNSDDSLVANWDSTGIAPVASAISPVLWFQSISNSDQIYFAVIPTTATISKALSITGTTSGLSCSFAGGCTYAIQASGLTAALMNSSNTVSVCSDACKLRVDLSDSNTAVCEVPPLATTFSVENYAISISQTLNETIFASNSSGVSVLNDQNVQNDYVDPATSGCYFGMQFKQGYVGILDQSQIFINYLTNSTPYADKLSFQGSNDGVTFTTLYTFDKSIHEGWNYIIYKEQSAKPAFNSYRFYGAQKGSCRVTEFRLIGVQAIQDTHSTYSCQPNITLGQSPVQVASTNVNPITYSSTNTPLLESIEPRFGSVLGGTTVTLTGKNLQGASFTNVTFDNRVCTVQSQTQTQIVCLTSDKPYVADSPKLNIYIDGFGNVATQGLLFYYVSLWSSTQTWGGDIPPLEGESVSIPLGQHLLVDVDSTPVLFAIIVEGSLIFAPDVNNPNHVRTFDANYIMIEGGYMEVGTEQFPYTSKMIITMHGDRYSPYLPMYGNKVIANRFGILDIHGVARNITWTRLGQTANVGDTQIVLLEYTDWAVGEEIVIAPTDFSNDQAETRIITAVEAGVQGTIISFADPILYKHISLVPEYDGIKIPMQGEVGLLTRNVVYRGDPETSAINQYGAHIMISSPGDESCIGRLEWMELKDVGQAYKLGRYPIHFHMIGTVMSSYVQGNSIHQTYNRAITAHNVHYLRILNNVAFNTMGHTFFIEDAVETHNYYNHNLAIQVRKSTALLNTDQTPGGFWITHPNNIFTNNAIAGSDAYGFWFDMQDHSTGPSYDINICPIHERLGGFSNNSAHSVHKYGLRIFHMLKPQAYPCLSSPYDGDYLKNNQTDPYWQNPRIEALFENQLSWKCERNGAITERTGFVTFKDFKIADSFIAGIEFSEVEDIADGYASIKGGIVVGNTFLNDDSQFLANTTSWGVIGPRTENFTVYDLRFYNFNFSKSAALGTCSHCYHPAATDSGGRTYKVQNLTFDPSTVPRRILYQIPFREIIHDLDGSLTGLGPDTWATSFWLHNLQPECSNSPDIHDGIICNSSVQVRRVAFYEAQPAALQMIHLKIAQWDTPFEARIKSDNQTLYDFQQDVSHTFFSSVEERATQDPDNSWSIPFVTGHRYRFHWGEGIDFTQLRVTPSNRWTPTDKYLHLMTNFTDVRASINITLRDSNKTQIANETYLQPANLLQTGDNIIYNQTSVREFSFVINGKNTTGKSDFYIRGYRCVVNCFQAAVAVVPINSTQIYWSQPSSWPKGVLPVAGDDVEILPGVNMVLDIETPILNQLTVNGRLTFLNNATAPLNLTIHAKIFYVRAGELIIGNKTNPYNGIAMIKLYGTPNDVTLAYSLSVMGGNKILAVLGSASFYGQPRDRMSRLRATANVGDSKILVYPGLDWTQGDRIALAPTATQNLHTDYGVISSYNNQTGEVYLNKPLNFYHWGAPTSTGPQYNGLDMRGEVLLLTRNVKVVGNDSDSWGGQVVVSDNIENTGVIRSGQITFDNVEIYNCSQRDTYNSAIRIEGANNLTQTVTNSAISGSLAWSFSSQGSSNVNVQNSTFVGSRQAGLVVMSSFNVTVNNSFVGDVISRPEVSADHIIDKEGCISMCAWNENDYCTDITLTNNIAAGCVYAGVIAPGHDCGASATQINTRNNVAHSVYGSGAFIFQNQSNPDHVNCYEGSYFSAYKCSDMGIATFFAVKETRMSHMTLVDNRLGVQIMTGYNHGDTSEKTLSVLSDSIIYGESQAQDCPQGANCYCKDKNAFLLFTNAIAGKQKHITSPSMFPLYKIKSYGTWESAASMSNITFKNFASNRTACGASQVIFAISEYSTDYVPLHQFTKTTFNNVSDDAIAYFIAPFPWWNDPAKCVAFPCTGPSNVVLTFEQSTFSGQTLPSQLNPSFQIVSNTAGASENLNSCSYKNAWNAWQCTNDYLGVLLAQALDDDWEDRTVSPVYVTNDNSNFTNVVNSFFDHTWDGVYSAQKHKTEFPSFIQTTGNYTVTYTGTPFKAMRYALRSKYGQIKVKVPYWNAGSYTVTVNDQQIPYTPWDSSIGAPAALTGNKGCGENRFVGVQNYLEFILTPGCELYVNPVNAITANVRMQWTLNQFYASGGVVSFASRVAAALGIQSYQIKTVAVYTGSVVVEYQITPATGDSNPDSSLSSIQLNLNKLVTSNSTAFGAPILSASTNGKSVVTDPNYKPPVNTNQPKTPTTNAFNAPQQATSQSSQQVTVQATSQTSSQAVVDVGSKSNSNLLIILLVLVLVFVCCFGCGTAIFCILRKKALNQAAAKKQTGLDINENKGVVVSEAELNPQFHPNQEFDVDIFSNKKRVLKMNEDFTDIGNANNISAPINTSEQKLMKYSDDGQQEIQESVNRN